MLISTAPAATEDEDGLVFVIRFRYATVLASGCSGGGGVIIRGPKGPKKHGVSSSQER